MAPPYTDPRSVAGKALHIDERCDLLVVGAGPAGLAAALEGAALGLSVVLADENPVPFATMGDDVPLQFGQRMSAAARNPGAMLEAFIASDPAIAEAFDAGVDVRLGTTVWGVWTNGPSVGWLPGPVAGLMDAERAWILGARAVVVAAGRRDIGLAFAGWERPGVMGLTAALRLALRYGALETRRAVLLGSSAEALDGALALIGAGVEIAAVIEVADAPIGPPELVAALHARGVEVHTAASVRQAEGSTAVEAVVVATRIGEEQRIACDTILLGVGMVPLIELLDSAGCQVAWGGARGGHVPVIAIGGATTVPGVYAAGDCAGMWAAKSREPALARAEGRAAARAATGLATEALPPATGRDPGADRLAWVRATVVEGTGEPYVCQCEEVTAREILEVRPPRYLAWPDDRRNRRDLRELLGNGAPNPDQVKRLTRAGMGLCQGRRCREQVAALLALSAGVDLAAIPPATHRAPVRPMPLQLAADPHEDPAMTAQWDVWFGMHAQYVPFWDVPGQYTAAGRRVDGDVSSE